MKCPICGSKAKVVDTKTLPAQTRRKHRCFENEHQFNTEEGRIGWRLTQDVHLRHSGDGQVQTVPFQPSRLRDEVGKAVMGRLTQAEIADVVEGAIAHLRYDVVPHEAELLTGDEYERLAKNIESHTGTRPQGPLAAIPDVAVRKAVVRELREREYRLAHVLYALYFEGRSNPKIGLQGWRTAEDVLRWLFSEDAYPKVNADIPERPKTVGYEWQPREPASYPEFVVKRGTELSITVDGGSAKKTATPSGVDDIEWPAVIRDRGVVGFLDSRFRQSIRHAVLGRPNAKQLATNVSWWVLHDLQGQKRVDSSQLAIGVLKCLRRVDDIAYLRWATQRKDFRSIREFRDEALGLITYPSIGLQFSAWGPSFKHLSMVGTDDADKGPLFRDLELLGPDGAKAAPNP